MQLLPKNIKRLTCTAFVSSREVERYKREDLIRTAAKQMVESPLRKLIEDCIQTEGDYMGRPGGRLKLDVYVMTPDELDRLVAEARAHGMRDAQRLEIPSFAGLTPAAIEPNAPREGREV
jgi:hypothetical protein